MPLDPMHHPQPSRAQLASQGLDGAQARQALESVYYVLSETPDDSWEAGHLAALLRTLVRDTTYPIDAVERCLAVAITGSAHTPDLYGHLAELGKPTALRRLRHAVRELSVVS